MADQREFTSVCHPCTVDGNRNVRCVLSESRPEELTCLQCDSTTNTPCTQCRAKMMAGRNPKW